MKNDIEKFNKNVEKYSDNPLSGNVFFAVAKKTEKIVTAIYMVTSFISEDDPLHVQIRGNAVTLLADVFSCMEASVVHKTNTLFQSIVMIEQLISLFDVARQMGMISEMNAIIIRKELMGLQNVLHTEIHQNSVGQTQEEPHTQIDQHSFLSELLAGDITPQQKTVNDINDTTMSFKDNVVYKQNTVSDKGIPKRQTKPERGEASKRRDQILDIFKTKKSISMKDLATRITNCTEKTLQRDLSLLIDQGHIEKKGSKRWSTYVYKG